MHRVDGDLTPLDERTCRYTAYIDSFQWLAVVMLLSDLEFTVEHPADFADYLRHQADRLRRSSPVCAAVPIEADTATAGFTPN